MQSWLTVAAKDMLAVVACCGIGAFIDFYIGKSGQRRVKDWLETWWLKSSYVRWGALGRDEALFAVLIFHLLLGNRLFSARRMIAVSMALGFGTIAIAYRLGEFYDLYQLLLSPYVLISFIFLFILTTLSFSITIFMSAKVAALLREGPFFNIAGLLFIILFQYCLVVFWYPSMEVLRVNVILGFTEINFFRYLIHLPHNINNMLSYLPGLFKSFPFPSWPSPIVLESDNPTVLMPSSLNHQMFFIAHLSDYMETYTPLLRVLIAVIFIISFFLQTAQRFIMTLWARIIESDKPVFTLLFTGIAGFAEIGQRIDKIF
jgi:hypothetical protein